MFACEPGADWDWRPKPRSTRSGNGGSTKGYKQTKVFKWVLRILGHAHEPMIYSLRTTVLKTTVGSPNTNVAQLHFHLLTNNVDLGVHSVPRRNTFLQLDWTRQEHVWGQHCWKNVGKSVSSLGLIRTRRLTPQMLNYDNFEMWFWKGFFCFDRTASAPYASGLKAFFLPRCPCFFSASHGAFLHGQGSTLKGLS